MNDANAARCAALKEKGIVPTLAVVRVGAREDDISYEKGIVTRCGKVGVEVRQFHLAEDVTQEELLDVIRQINGDASVHGCLIFRPLPKRFDDRRVQEALAPEKDVDGMTAAGMGGLMTVERNGFAPCTAAACMEMLRHYHIPLRGKNVTVVGTGRTVGMLALEMMLLCFAVGVLVQLYLQSAPGNFAVISAAAALLVLSCDWLFFYRMPGYSGSAQRYLWFVLPSAALTIPASLVEFAIVRHIYNKFKIDNGVV